ncbi:MAG: GNA1162 family protein [Thermodesulfobacteriota bacterium]
MRHVLFAILCLGLLLAGAGCAHVSPDPGKATAVGLGEPLTHFTGEFENTPQMRQAPPRSVAVLPFTGDPARWGSTPEGEDPRPVLRKAFYNHFASLPFRDMELDETDRRLREAGLDDPAAQAQILAQDPGRLKSVLGVDAVVAAEVTHYDRLYLGLASLVSVGCEVRMVSLSNGGLLWRAQQVSRGFGGGVSESPLGLLTGAIAALWNLRHEELYSQTDELFREMVTTIGRPENPAPANHPPVITLFAALRPDRPLRRGEEVRLRLVGEPGCDAYADLGTFRTHIPLQPLGPAETAALRQEIMTLATERAQAAGRPLTPELATLMEAELAARTVYEGTYAVEPEAEAYGLAAKGYLVRVSGSQALRVDPGPALDIDARPPAPPAGLAAEPLDRRLRLTWAESPDADLAGYEVYLSASGLTGFALAAKSEHGAADVDNLENFTPVFLRVAAVDKAGNVSEMSAYAKAAPLPDPALAGLPTPGPALDGVLMDKVLLRADKGPFLVRDTLVVGRGAALHVEPGAVLRFAAGAGLAVRGGELAVYGAPRRPVRLIPADAAAPPGSWAGVLVDEGGRARLEHAEIQGAEVGLTIHESAPSLRGMRILGCSQAGLVLDDGARPVATCSRIAGNLGMGGLVAQGTGLAPSITSTSFADNEPFDVQNFAPVELDLTGNWWGGSAAGPKVLGPARTEPALTYPPADCP